MKKNKAKSTKTVKAKKTKMTAPKVVALDPLSVEARYRRFIEETEGKENKGGDPRLNQPTRTDNTTVSGETAPKLLDKQLRKSYECRSRWF